MLKSKKAKNEVVAVNADTLTANYEQTVLTNEDEAFRQYQEDEKHTKQAKRARLILGLFTALVYLLGLGIFAILAIDIYKEWKIAGIVVGALLFAIYSVCFFYIVSDIYSKPAFDLGFARNRNNKFSERKNNEVRWEIANNIVNQAKAINGLYTKKEDEQQSLAAIEGIICNANGKTLPYKSEESQKLAQELSNLLKKNGVVYKKANKIIWKAAVSCGILTALSQNAVTDVGIVVIKDLQLIKDIVWLYGFRPTDSEMNRIMYKVIKAVGLSIGMNELPKGISAASKIFNKASSNLVVGFAGSVLDFGAQFLGNGVMTYLLGCQTVKTLLKEYRLQDTFRQYVSASEVEYLMPEGKEIISGLNKEIVDRCKHKKDPDEEEPKPVEAEPVNESASSETPKEKEGFLNKLNPKNWGKKKE